MVAFLTSGIRKDLTDGLWKRHPNELAGTWELTDVAGTGSLRNIMTPGTATMNIASASKGVGSFVFSLIRFGGCAHWICVRVLKAQFLIYFFEYFVRPIIYLYTST